MVKSQASLPGFADSDFSTAPRTKKSETRVSLFSSIARAGRQTPASTSHCSSGSRVDILVYPEQVRWIVLLLHHRQALVVVAIGRFQSRIALVVHHEIRVSAGQVERMHRFPIGLGPARYRACLLRVRIDPRDHHRPGRIAAIPGRLLLTDAMDGAIDR